LYLNYAHTVLSSAKGNGHNLANARQIMPEEVHMDATRAIPSLPACVSSILPNLHFAGGRLSSLTRTSAPRGKCGKWRSPFGSLLHFWYTLLVPSLPQILLNLLHSLPN